MYETGVRSLTVEELASQEEAQQRLEYDKAIRNKAGAPMSHN
jgi:hypothetical protein